MPTPSACPSVESLKQFRLGLSPEAQALQLEQHLSGCPSCLGRLATVAPDDALVQGLRAQRNRPRLNNPVLAQVQQDLRAPSFRAQFGQPNEPTVGVAPASELATVAGPAGAVNALGMAHGFLSPPKDAGEIGWLGPFRVLRVLGEGGMGVVLQAEDSRLQRRVALKVMKPELASDPSARQRFFREARATAALEHEHVIAIHHIDECNGAPYLAMPLLQGESLEDRLRREPRLPLAEVLRIGRETAKGLAAAHERELIHRDIKPGNLWLEAPSGRVKILDFGLAAMACPEGEKTLPGTILGTPGYMAPEQTEGKADPRADLFSLGCLLYRLTTGRPPFKGQSLVEKIRSTLFDTPEPPQQINPALPAPLCNLIQRLMARKPEDRPATALVVARVLETIESQLPHGVTAPVAIPVPAHNTADATVAVAPAAIPLSSAATSPIPPWIQRLARNRKGLMIGGGSAAALLLLILVLVIASRKPASPKEQARAEGEKSASEETTIRRPVPPRKRPAEGDMPVEVTPDRSFPETWVVKSEPIEGLKGWSIEANGVGQANYPLAFNILADDRLLIYFIGDPNPNIGGNRWMQFDPKTCGLVRGPFDGSYDAVSPDARICARSVTGGVQLWEQGGTKAWTTLRSPGRFYEPVFSTNGKKIVTLNQISGEMWFWDVQEGSKLGVCSISIHPNQAKTLTWSSDSVNLAAASVDGVALFRAPWNKSFKTISWPGDYPINALAWSPDGKYLAIVDRNDKHVHVLDVEKGKSIADIEGSKVALLNLTPAWSPDGKELAFATEDKKVVVWNLAENKATFTFTGHTRSINAVAFLPDNKTLVSGSQGSVRFWDLEKNRLRGSLLKFEGDNWLAIDPDGNYRGSPDVEKRFVYKVREENNRLREFSPEDFSKLYGWKNHPERVKLVGD
jgi:serine/threonine protein kinase